MRSHIARLAAVPIAVVLVVALRAAGDDPSVANTVLSRLRVVTWNLHQGYSDTNQHVNDAQLDLLASLQPDVVAFQELAEWDNNMPLLYEQGLEARTGRNWTLRYERHLPNASLSKAEGVAVATWLPVDADSVFHMTDPTAPDDLIRNRAAVRLQVTVNQSPLNLITSHLDYLDVVDRRSQLDRLQAWVDTFGPRRIVAGDFNAEPGDDATLSAWRPAYVDAWDLLVFRLTGDQGWTMNQRTVTGLPGRIDYHWVANATPRAVSVVKTHVSDHNILVVDYEMPPAGTPLNVPPAVTLTSPSAGTGFVAPASIDLAAQTSDTDGSVASVTFYAGSEAIGTDTTAPFAIRWDNVPAGNYSLTAVAFDDRSGRTVSSPVAVTVTAPSSDSDLPPGWASQDVGAVGLAGSAAETGGVFTLQGAGADIWGSADSFRFAYLPLSGDGEVRARVTSLDNTHLYAKAGVMIRETLAANSRQMTINAKPDGALEVLVRAATGGTTSYLGGATAGFPVWVRLQRSANTTTAAWSKDGTAWTTVATTTVSMTSGVYAGLALTSHVTTVLATGRFDNVLVTGPPPPPSNAAPSVSLTSPVSGQAFTEPATIALAGTATDSDGSIVKVEFYNGATLLATDTAAPYEGSWTNVTAGTYTLTAVATDNAGAATTSAPVSITVGAAPPPPANAPPSVTLTAPSSGQAFTAPATVSLAATASDSDGSIAKVEFYSGTTLLATDTAAPYEGSWANVAAGTYTLTAVATDNAGAAATSAPVSITVSAPAPQPTLGISVSPSKRIVNSGGTARYSVTLTATGLTTPAVFSVTGLPTYATASFSPPSLSASGTTTLSIKVPSSAPRGSSSFTIAATSGNATATTSAILEIRK